MLNKYIYKKKQQKKKTTKNKKKKKKKKKKQTEQSISYKSMCTASDDSDKPAHPHYLIGLSWLFYRQPRILSVFRWTAPADLSLS